MTKQELRELAAAAAATHKVTVCKPRNPRKSATRATIIYGNRVIRVKGKIAHC